ncbi:amidohydrolase family protein [Parvularcula sp. ZS-1/3]|uniref:Amidohydrolase family protein n=1 Tax=Parvularcula mediterranea TaxID=2732508 RepID=A0A7Y3RPV5_9PROT|nr:amidohydrolase family protein [Parvularcula mediterranea]
MIDVETGRVIPDQSVVIRGDRIVEVASQRRVVLARSSRVISGEGLFLMPGLWDAHVHVFSAEGEPDVALPLYILHGVTSIRDMGALVPLREQLTISEAIAAGNRVGPRIVPAGAMIDGPPGSWPGQMVAASPEEGRLRVREAANLGWTSVKAYSLLDRATYLAIADEATKLGLPLYGHVPEAVRLDEAVAAGQDVVEHVGRVTKACSRDEAEMVVGAQAALSQDEPFDALMAEMAAHTMRTFKTWDEKLCRRTVDRLAAVGIAVAPTLMVADFYLGDDPQADDPRMLTVPANIREGWGEPDFRRAAMTDDMLAIAPEAVRQDRRTFKLAHEAGVTILASSDAAFLNPFLFHGFTLIEEVERYVDIGLSPGDALATATINPARLFGNDGETGRVEEGRRADLILLRRSPLEDIRALREIETVVAAGRVFDRNDLDALEADLRRRAEEAVPD